MTSGRRSVHTSCDLSNVTTSCIMRENKGVMINNIQKSEWNDY